MGQTISRQTNKPVRAFKIVKRNKRIAKHDAAGSFLLSTVLKIKSKAGKPLFTSLAFYLLSLFILSSLFQPGRTCVSKLKGAKQPLDLVVLLASNTVSFHCLSHVSHPANSCSFSAYELLPAGSWSYSHKSRCSASLCCTLSFKSIHRPLQPVCCFLHTRL